MPIRWICDGCGASKDSENHLPECPYIIEKRENIKNRLTRNSNVVCNLDLDWANTGKVCRDLVKNNAEGVMKHMIEKHGWRVIPELAQRECKTKEDEFAKMRLYSEDPKQWFLDNQFIFIEFKRFHFKNPMLVS